MRGKTNGLEALRKIQLDILREFVEMCEREGLAYFAMFGTMIGAVRHGGFIPWDDDIDVAMPRADYDKLCDKSEFFTKPYFLQTPDNDPGACPRFARLMNLETTYITKDYPNSMTRGGRMGCRIDILPLDVVPGKLAAQKLAQQSENNLRKRRKSAALMEMTFMEMPDWKQKSCREVLNKSYSGLTYKYHDICTRYEGSKRAKYYTIAALHGDQRALLLPKKCFDGYSETVFDGLNVRVPKGFMELSDIIYENGVELPEESERKPKHTGFFDKENPYIKYTARYENVFRGLSGKKILLFGAGNMLNIYMARYGKKYPPVCTFDNDVKKLGSRVCGVEVKNPNDILSMTDENTRIIIISLHHREIGKQLEKMGIMDYSVFIDGWKYEEKENES